MRFTKVIFWEPTVSPHKADFFSAFAAATPGCEVICVADQDMLANRREMGWTVPVAENYELIISPTEIQVFQLTSMGKDVLHIFSGIRHVPSIVAALKNVKKYKQKFAIMSEPRVAEGVKGLLRYFQSWLTEGWLRRNTAFVLGIGRNGPPWFISVGYSKNKVFPFAYFIDAQEESNAIPRKGITVAYVGRLTQSKGVRDLFEAMTYLNGASLTVVGSGELDADLKNYARINEIDAQFVGVKKITEIPSILANVDVLVLPSITKDDGWGVVVSESLLAGTAAIATDCVGASILLDDPRLGCVVSANDPVGIASAINKINFADGFSIAARQERKKLAKSMLTGEAGADYLLKIIRHKFEGEPCPSPFFSINRP